MKKLLLGLLVLGSMSSYASLLSTTMTIDINNSVCKAVDMDGGHGYGCVATLPFVTTTSLPTLLIDDEKITLGSTESNNMLVAEALALANAEEGETVETPMIIATAEVLESDVESVTIAIADIFEAGETVTHQAIATKLQ